MSKKSEAPQSRRHIWVFDEDWEFLSRAFGESIGVGPAIRRIVQLHVNGLRAKQQRLIDEGAAARRELGE